MKIGILTLRLYNNYGGILQNYALCHFLKLMGHDVETFKLARPISWKRKIKNGLKKILCLHNNIKDYKPFNRAIQEFIQKEIPQTSYRIISSKQFLYDSRIQSYDAYIVGSDQVWRRPYMEFGIRTMFLDFVKKQRKISYAASFGIDNLSEYSLKEIDLVKKCLSTYKAVSLREDEGVGICSSIGVDAVNVLDPVFLLSVTDYEELAMRNTKPSEGNLFGYILDDWDKNCSIIKNVAKENGFSPFFITLTLDEENKSVEQWLRSFYDADFIITDSFHACAFSIIFNKNFYIIGNKGRGLSRINSLLDKFNLKNRLIPNVEDLYNQSFKGIDWINVNKRVEELKELSISFLQNNLK